MEEIIVMLETLKEDKGFAITNDIIKQYIEDNIDLLVEEISKEIGGA